MKKIPSDSFIFEIVLDKGEKRAKIAATDYYRHFIKSLPLGSKGVMYLSLKKPTRTESQLAYYFVLCGMIAENCGYSKEEAHEWLMVCCFGVKEITVNGVTKEVRKSISDRARMTNQEAQDLIDFTLATCRDLNINVPTREELGYVK